MNLKLIGKGRMSTFGGPRDTGMSATEDLAFLTKTDLADPKFQDLFLPMQPEGTSGLGRRLNPDRMYVACRWVYAETSKEMLRHATVRLTANGREVYARPADWGPHADTGRIADLSPGAAKALGLQTDDEVTVELVLPDASPTVTLDDLAKLKVIPIANPGPLSMGADHWLNGPVTRIPIPGGEPMAVRRCVVEHFTGGATAKSSIDALRERGLSVHFVVDRDGTIFQCRPCNVTASHAGKSRWRDPKTNVLYDGLNQCSIGIEIANAGDDQAALSWARKQVGFRSVRARHRNGGVETEWESYSPAQISAVRDLTYVLVKRYSLDDVTGHDCIAPERKNDPGPAFPMDQIRAACGFSGLPVVHHI